MHGVVMAGGSGKRLWPRARRSFPKYLLRLDGEKSLLEKAVDRLASIIPADNIMIITNKEHVRVIADELPQLPVKNIIAEPVSKNTAPAIALASLLVNKKDPEGILFIVPADHFISEERSVKDIFSLASLIVSMKDALVTIGIRPTFPSTGFGYIKAAKLYKRLIGDKMGYEVYKVESFTEKPSLKKAKSFLKSKRYLWNCGIFVGKAKTFLKEFKRYQPKIYEVAKRIGNGIGTKNQTAVINRYYKDFPDISIDYAVMERTPLAYVVKSDMAWQDIGSWTSIEGYIDKDQRGNIITAEHIGIDIKNSIIMGEKDHLIATIGLKDMILIHTPDVTLVCLKERVQDVKRLVDLAREKNLLKYL